MDITANLDGGSKYTEIELQTISKFIIAKTLKIKRFYDKLVHNLISPIYLIGRDVAKWGRNSVNTTPLRPFLLPTNKKEKEKKNMAKKAITEVESKIKKILANKEAETVDLEERVETAKRQQRSANEAMDIATTAGDVKAYQKAKADRRDAEDAIEMHGKRLEALENKPLIPGIEYEKGVAQIMAALGEVSADAKNRIVEHMEQIRIIAAECTAEITYGNDVLHQWQHDIYRDKAEQAVGIGKGVHMDNLEKRFRDYSVSQFASYVLDSGYYKTFTGQSR